MYRNRCHCTEPAVDNSDNSPVRSGRTRALDHITHGLACVSSIRWSKLLCSFTYSSNMQTRERYGVDMHFRCGGSLPFAGDTQRRRYGSTAHSAQTTEQGYPYSTNSLCLMP